MPHSKNDQSVTAEEASSIASKPFGYEVLRSHVYACRPGAERDAQLKSFTKADEGDERVLEYITVFLQNPKVKKLIGVAA